MIRPFLLPFRMPNFQIISSSFQKLSFDTPSDIFALPLDEYRTKVQAFKAYLRAYSRKHLDSQDTVLFVESRMNPERTLTAMLQTNLMSEDE